MTSLQDLTTYDDEHCSDVDALPLEAVRFGRRFRCTDKSGCEAASPQTGQVVGESSRHGEYCLVDDALPLEATRVGRGFRCTDQTDSEVGRLYVSSQVGQVVRESSERRDIGSEREIRHLGDTTGHCSNGNVLSDENSRKN